VSPLCIVFIQLINIARELVAFAVVLLLMVFMVSPFDANTGVARTPAVTRATAVTMVKIANLAVVFFVFIRSVTKILFI
jgi:hypothetical protein